MKGSHIFILVLVVIAIAVIVYFATKSPKAYRRTKTRYQRAGGQALPIGGGCYVCQFQDGSYMTHTNSQGQMELSTACSSDSQSTIHAFVSNCNNGNGQFTPVGRPYKSAAKRSA